MNKKYKLHNKNVKKTQKNRLKKNGGSFNFLGKRTRSGQQKQFHTLLTKKDDIEKYSGIGDVLDRLKTNTDNYEKALNEFKKSTESLQSSEANYSDTYAHLNKTIMDLDNSILEIYNLRNVKKNVDATTKLPVRSPTDANNGTSSTSNANNGTSSTSNANNGTSSNGSLNLLHD